MCVDSVLPTTLGTCRGSWAFTQVNCPDPRGITYQTCCNVAFGFEKDASGRYVYGALEQPATYEQMEATLYDPGDPGTGCYIDPSTRSQECPGARAASWGPSGLSTPSVGEQAHDRASQMLASLEVGMTLRPSDASVQYTAVAFESNELTAGYAWGDATRMLQQRVTTGTNPPGNPWPQWQNTYTKRKFMFASPKYACDAAPPCPVTDPGGVMYSACTLASLPTYTASGLTLAQMRQQYPGAPSDDVLAHVPSARQAVCTTHDAMTYTDAASVRAKFVAVETDYKIAQGAIDPNSANLRADALGKMVTELGTLFLLRTTSFDDDLIVRITNVLKDNASAVALCGNKYKVLETLFAHALGSTTTAGRQEEATARLAILRGILEVPLPDAPTAHRAELLARVRLMGKWYATSESSAAVATSRDDDDAAVVGSFYQGVYAPELAKLRALRNGTGPNDIAARGQALQDVFTADFRADRDVLSALYPQIDPSDPTTTTLPLTGPLAARLTGAALVPIAQRLRTMGTIHDYACAFVDCTKTTAATESTRSIWRLLGSLASQTDFASALALLPQNDDWRVAMQGIADHFPAYLESVGATGSSSIFSTTAAFAPAHARDLARVVEDARLRTVAFSKTGAFELSGRNTLQANLDDVRLDSPTISNLRTASIAGLTSVLTNYAAHRDALLVQMLNELDDTQRLSATNAQVTETVIALNTTTDELQALRRHTSDDAAKFSDFLKAFGTTIDNEGVADQRISREPAVTFDVQASGDHSSGDLRVIGAITKVGAAVPTPISAKKGDFISFSVLGDWSPVCAIKKEFDARKARVNGVAGAADPKFDVQYAVTGPEGYRVQTASDTTLSIGESNSSTSTSSVGAKASLSLCAENEVGAPGFITTILGASSKLKVSACTEAYADTSSSSSNGSSSASNDTVRNSAAFESGIRVPGTLNAAQPAGALLVYILPKGATSASQAIDVRVVHRNDGLMITGDPRNSVDGAVDLYFVANDGTCSDASGKLNVTVQKFTTVGATAQDVGRRMVDALSAMRASGDVFAQQGTILPSESTQLRDAARQAVGADLPRMPEVVKGLFELWVDAELGRIERSVEIRRRLLAVDASVRQLATLREAADTAAAKNRLAEQLTYWSLQALEADDLSKPIRDVTTAYGSLIRPILRLRYPSLMQCLGGTAPTGSPPGEVTACAQVQADFNALLAITPSQSISEIAQMLVKSANGVKGVLTNFDPHIKPQQLDIAVRVPNPFIVFCSTSGDGGGGWDDVDTSNCTQRVRTTQEDDLIAKTRLTSNPVVARAIWSALLGPTGAGRSAYSPNGTFFRLSPEDIYSSATADKNNALPCNQGAPIVNQMAIVVSNTGEGKDTINGAQKAALTSRETSFVFTTSQGAETFDLQVGGAQNETFNVPILDSNYSVYMQTYTQEKSGPSGSRFSVPLASSPFTGYRIFVSDTVREVFGTQLTSAPEVYLMMTTDVLPLSNVGWVTSCR